MKKEDKKKVTVSSTEKEANPIKKGRGSNLTSEDRAKGGRMSALHQKRDELGKFTGRKG